MNNPRSCLRQTIHDVLIGEWDPLGVKGYAKAQVNGR